MIRLHHHQSHLLYLFSIHRRLLHTEPLATTPLVLLFGWLGADTRHLNKYAELYRSFGADVLTAQPSILQTAVPFLAVKLATSFAASVVSHEEERQLESPNRPVIVHVLSNAGFLCFGTLLHLCHHHHHHPQDDVFSQFKSTIIDNLRGIVIDSAPSRASPAIWARGTLTALLQKPVDADALEHEHPVALKLAYNIAQRYLALPQVSKHLRNARAAWTHAVPPPPLPSQLFLFSTSDGIVPASHVEAFMSTQAARGVSVASHCWRGSGHVEHYKVYPEQYTRIVHSFVQRSLTDVADVRNAM